MKLWRTFPAILLLISVAGAAGSTRLDLGKTGLKASMAVPAGTQLENMTGGSWRLTDPQDFSLNLYVVGKGDVDADSVRGSAEMKGAAGDVYTFKRYVTNTPDFYVIEGALYGKPTYIVGLRQKVGGKTVYCGSDLNSTYSRALADRQVAACRSIKAK